jgi:hypothetical protein
MAVTFCKCGWERPLICLATKDGNPSACECLPFYSCPRCGAPHFPRTLTEDQARAIHEVIVSMLSGGRGA